MKDRLGGRKGVFRVENNENNQEVVSKRLICFYCGTIYDAERGRCPLCGSTATSGESEEQPADRQDTEKPEKKEAKGKYAKPGKRPSNGFLIAAVILLALAVCVVTYFIGDMIGLWPGLEDNIVRETQNTNVTEQVKCSQLVVEPLSIDFAGAGETQTVTVRVNADCDEVTYCTSSNASVAIISQEGETSEGAQMKSASFLVTAVGSGEAELVFTCGDQTATCLVTCAEETSETTEAEPTFYPELNFLSTVVLTEEEAQAIVRVVNLPDGGVAEFSSSNEDVVTVDEKGFVTAVGEGTATVTADVRGQTAEVVFNVDFSESGPHLDDTDFDLDVDKYFILHLLDENDDEIEDARFVAEDPEILEIREERIYGLAEGVTQVVVTYRDMVYVCVVTVE